MSGRNDRGHALLSNLPQFHLLMSPFLPYQEAFPPSSFAYTTLPLLFQSKHYEHISHILFSHHFSRHPYHSESTDAASEEVAAEELEKDVLKSECGMDYVPLANMLLIGDFKAADQFTRDALIQIAGEGARKRGYVYFTEVKGLPQADMATIEKLWLKYSKGKFGFTVQRALWNQVTVGKDFERFCRKIGWNMMENGIERKLKWFGNSEFTYDLDKAPTGHLPLTSALRGTSLLKNLLTYPMWDTDWNKEEKKE